MAKFFINRPIVAMVISILMVIVGVVAMVQLPIAQFPNIAPPEIQLTATYPGADALTLEQSVATPIEQQMSGVDNMIYMYSTNARPTAARCSCASTSTSPPTRTTDQILAQMRYSQAAVAAAGRRRNRASRSRSPDAARWRSSRCTRRRAPTTRSSSANYAYININDPMTRVPGVGQVPIFGAGQYAMRLLGQPRHAVQARHHGQRDPRARCRPEHREPGRPDRRRAGAAGAGVHLHVRAQGRLITPRSSATSSSAPTPTARSCACGTWRASSSGRRPTTRKAA